MAVVMEMFDYMTVGFTVVHCRRQWNTSTREAGYMYQTGY